ncbi:unnamed protein product [Caenorhabditis brenneri]
MGDYVQNPYYAVNHNLPVRRISCRRCRAEIQHGNICGRCGSLRTMGRMNIHNMQGVRTLGQMIPGPRRRTRATVRLCSQCKHPITARQRVYKDGKCYPCHTGKERKTERERNNRPPVPPNNQEDINANESVALPATQHVRHTKDNSLVVTLPVAEPVQQAPPPQMEQYQPYNGYEYPNYPGYDNTMPSTSYQPEFQYPAYNGYPMHQDNQYNGYPMHQNNQHNGYTEHQNYQYYEQPAPHMYQDWQQPDYNNQQPMNGWDTDYGNGYNWAPQYPQ